MAAAPRAYWLRSGFFTLVERFALQALGMGTVMILLRAFAQHQETYGVWVLYTVVAAFLEVARNGLIQNALVKYASGATEDNYRRIGTASFVLNIAVTLAVNGVLLLMASWLSTVLKAPGLAPLIRIYAVANLAMTPLTQFNIVQQANLNFKGPLYANLTRQLLFFGFVAFTYWSGRRLILEQLAWMQVIAAFVGSLVAYRHARPYLRLSPSLDLVWMGKLARFGVFTFGTNLGAMIYKATDRFMLGILMPTQLAAMRAVALLDPALRITGIMEIPIHAMATIVYPQGARRLRSGGTKAIQYLYEKSVGTLLALLLPLCIVVLLVPGIFITFLAGSEEAFAGASDILRVTILYTLFVPFGRQFGTTMDVLGKPSWSFGFVLASTMTNIVSNYFFIRAYGVIGAAYGTLLTHFVKFIAQQIALNHFIGVRTLRVFGYTLLFYRQLFEALRGAWNEPDRLMEKLRSAVAPSAADGLAYADHTGSSPAGENGARTEEPAHNGQAPDSTGQHQHPDAPPARAHPTASDPS